MTSTIEGNADVELKAKHRALWASGDYPRVATELIPQLGPALVDAAGVRSGQHVLDVAAGSGNAAIPAAERGARVVASALTPELFAAGRRQAAERGVILEWVEADAEALPFPFDSFDVVLSCVGGDVRTPAPDRRRRAGTRGPAGGTIGLINWTPEGLIGNLFKTLAPYAPPPAPGAMPPPLWGDEDHLRRLFGDQVTDLQTRRQRIVMGRVLEPLEFRAYWKSTTGPRSRSIATAPTARTGSPSSTRTSSASSPPGDTTTAKEPASRRSTSWSPHRSGDESGCSGDQRTGRGRGCRRSSRSRERGLG